jgi:dipeptidyl-peptidase-4
MTEFKYRALSFGLVAILLPSFARAEGAAADYARAEQFFGSNLKNLAFRLDVRPHFIGDSGRFWYRLDTRSGHEFVLVDPQRNTRALAFDHVQLASALALATGRQFTATTLPLDDIEFATDDRAIAVRLGAQRWSCDRASYQCAATAPPPAADELPSPDSHWVAFLRGHNLYVRSTATREEIALTDDGEAHFDYGTHPGSGLSFVTDQVEHAPALPLALWSPDSKRLITHRLDERKVREMYLLQAAPLGGGLQPVLWPYRYPFPGDAVVPTVQMYVFDIESHSRVMLGSDPQLVLYDTPLELHAFRWSEDSWKVYFLEAERGLKSVRFSVADSRTGAVRKILEERGPTYVQTNPSNVRVIGDGVETLSYSERDGWAHLYLHDTATGALKRQITRGAWRVEDVLWVDARARRVYFTARGHEAGRDPYFRHLYRAGLDGAHLELLTPEDADHEPRFAPNGRYFVDTYSRVDLPPTSVLRTADGKLVRVLETADIEPLIAIGWKPPERFSAKAADGVTDLYGVIYRPSRFDASKSYPVIDDIYPGPQSIRTPKNFRTSGRGDPQSLAELGFIVVIVDGRGTPYRSKTFHNVSYGHIEQAGHLEDHIAVVHQLAARYPQFDLLRVGVTGHSQGGYAAARAMLAYPDFYKVGVSSAGVHDMGGYNADLGEIYQGMPDGTNYQGLGNRGLATNLKGKLLLIYGDMDDNVPPALTIQLVDALIKANKDFDLLLLPNGNHARTFTDPYVIRRRWDFFVRHLLGVEPPAGYSIAAGKRAGAE